MDAPAAPKVDFDANKVRVTDEAHLSADFDLDSLDQLELLILIEEEFSGVEFSDTVMDAIEVVGDLIRYIEITNKAPGCGIYETEHAILRS